MGAPQYLTITILDVAFAINAVYQHMSHPTPVHLSAIQRMFRCMAGTID